MNQNSRRIIAYDHARALAVIGMVFVNTTNIMGLCKLDPGWIDTAIGFVCGRAAVVFVMLAGTGLVLAYDRTPDLDKPALKRRLVKRSIWLFAAGILLMRIWEMDILHYYSAFFLLGIGLLKAPARRIKKNLVFVALASMPLCALSTYVSEGGEALGGLYEMAAKLPLLGQYLLSDAYPVFPWFGFFMTGMLLGRLERFPKRQYFRRFVVGGILVCAVVEYVSAALNSEALPAGWEFAEWPLWQALTASEAFPVTPLFVFSAAASGVVLISLCRLLPDRLRVISRPDPLAAFGRLSLTMYVSHILIGSALNAWIVAHHGRATSAQILVFAVGFVFSGIAFAAIWIRRYKRGPLERALDGLTRLSFKSKKLSALGDA
jgi:uncharacterized protein